MFKYFFPLVLLAGSLFAQYPGQYPPGQYPGSPGGYPGGGISIPSRGHKKKDQGNGKDANRPSITAEGQTVSNDGKTLVVATKDGRTLSMAVTPKTKFTRSGNDIEGNKIIPRTTVHVEAFQDDEANLSAGTVDLLKDAPQDAPPGEQPRKASPNQSASDEEMTRPTILKDPVDVPDRPVLRHGKPPATQTDSDDSATQTARSRAPSQAPSQPSSSPQSSDRAKSGDNDDFVIDGEGAPVKTKVSPSQDLIERTRTWAMTFTEGLPNFVCSQMTTRYAERSKSEGWQPIDVISAKVLYEDRKETYKEITVGGKRTNKSMLELGGSTSTGEFASILGGLFEQNRAEFKFFQSNTISGQPAAIYDFKVPLQNSNWTISIGGQTLRPAYSGSVWVDRATAQVRRIEMQAENIPKDFPEDNIQSAVDYEEVSLGTNKFLLPVHAENLGCERGSPICTKNTIDFRDYHKYSGESTITFK